MCTYNIVAYLSVKLAGFEVMYGALEERQILYRKLTTSLERVERLFSPILIVAIFAH